MVEEKLTFLPETIWHLKLQKKTWKTTNLQNFEPKKKVRDFWFFCVVWTIFMSIMCFFKKKATFQQKKLGWYIGRLVGLVCWYLGRLVRFKNRPSRILMKFDDIGQFFARNLMVQFFPIKYFLIRKYVRFHINIYNNGNHLIWIQLQM